jgi:RecB family exonuclease
MCVEAARERLTLSYARADAGRSARHVASYFFRLVAEQVAARRLSAEELESGQHVRRIEAGRLACDDGDASLSLAEYDRGLVKRADDDAPAVITALSRDAERTPLGDAVAARGARWSGRLTPFDGAISPALAGDALKLSPFATDRPVSASRLEMYATCPYRYFLRHTLRVEPVEEPEAVERIDHLQRGSLIHEILQAFLTRLGRDDPPSNARRDEHLAILAQVAEEAFASRVERGVTGRPLIWAIDRRAIESDLARWYDAEVRDGATSGMLPGAFEARFGPAGAGMGEEDAQLSSDDPIVLHAGGRELRVQGRIDRIDWDRARTRFRVIDYKTGKFRASGKLLRGEALQLPIYLHAAAALLGLDASAGSAEYFYVSSRGKFRRHPFTGADAEARRADLERVLTTIADGVDSGFFAPNPRDGHCQWCEYRDVCDIRIGKVMDRKTGDPRGDAYLALREVE